MRQLLTRSAHSGTKRITQTLCESDTRGASSSFKDHQFPKSHKNASSILCNQVIPPAHQTHMMAHKFSEGLVSLFRAGSSSLRVRPFAPTTTEAQARRALNHTHALTPFSNTAYLTPRSHQWEGVQVLEEDCLQENSVSRTADTSLINRRKQKDQKPVQSPHIFPGSPTTPSPLGDRPRRRRRIAGAMPRCGYDTTNMRVATNPRPAASAGGSGCPPRNDKLRSDGKSDGGSGSGSGGSDREEGNIREDDEKGSKKTKEQESGRGSKDGGMTTEELIKTIDDVRLPMEGRGWTFWL